MTYRLGRTSRDAVQTAEDQGLFLPERPENDMPFIPRDLTTVEDADLMETFSELTSWADYAATQLAAAQVDERVAEKRLAQRESVLMVTSSDASTRGDRVTVIKAKVAADPSVIDLSDSLDAAYAYRKVVEALHSNLERDISLISRELTRRTSNTQPRRNRITT